MVVFGGRDETAARLDGCTRSVLATDLARFARRPPPPRRAASPTRDPSTSPRCRSVRIGAGEPYPLARSGAAAVVSPDNVMFGARRLRGGGATRDSTAAIPRASTSTSFGVFLRPRTSGDLPVRRNKHTAVIDEHKRMWVWGGSVWDHTVARRPAGRAPPSTHVADGRGPSRVTWTRVETRVWLRRSAGCTARCTRDRRDVHHRRRGLPLQTVPAGRSRVGPGSPDVRVARRRGEPRGRSHSRGGGARSRG